MARTVDEIKSELRKVSEDTRKAYDLLNGTSGRGGLDRDYRIALRDKNQKVIDRLKPKWEAAQADYKKFQEQKNALTKELKTAEQAASEKKTSEAKSKSATSVYDKALEKLNQASIGIDAYKGTEKYVAAYQAAQQAYNDAVAVGAKPTPLPAQLAPVPPVKVETTDKGGAGTQGQPQELTFDEIKNNLSDPANKQQLIDTQKYLIKNWGYTGKADGVYTLNFQNALQSIGEQRAQLPVSMRGESLGKFIQDQNKSVFSGTTTGTGTGTKYQPTANIYSENEAANTVQGVVSSLLNRDATAQEVKNFSKKLIAAQSDPKNAVRQTLNKKTGILETTGGINATQFVEDLVRGTDEYKGLLQKAESKKQTALNVAKNSLQDTILANGLDATMFKDLDAWAQKVADGEDPSYYKGLIRQTAKMGMPDNVAKLLDQGVDLETIYAPYKTLMQNTLEIPAGQLNLNDPTLRSAIGAEKPMTIYDFKNALRKDPRWQFTSDAKSTVNGAVQKVLQDFGFMG